MLAEVIFGVSQNMGQQITRRKKCLNVSNVKLKKTMPLLQNTAHTNRHLFTSTNTPASRRWVLNATQAEKHCYQGLSQHRLHKHRDVCLLTLTLVPQQTTYLLADGPPLMSHNLILHKF